MTNSNYCLTQIFFDGDPPQLKTFFILKNVATGIEVSISYAANVKTYTFAKCIKQGKGSIILVFWQL